MGNKHLNKSECLQRRLFAVSFVSGFLITIFCLSLHAYEGPEIEISSANAGTPTITIDAEHGVDYKQVDRFIDHMNSQQKVKYAKVKDNEIILSESPIVEIPKYLARPAVQPTFEPVPYTPVTLADLGMRYTPETNVTPSENVQLADNQLRAAPAIPEFIATPVTAIHETPVAPAQYSNIHNSVNTSLSPTLMYLIRAIFAAASLIIILMLYKSSVRRDTPPLYVSRYSGKLGVPTEMVGEGGLFNFDETTRLTKIPLDSTYLSMMWHLGRFSTDSNVNTYFYMAFYVPSQQQYASELRKQHETETTT